MAKRKTFVYQGKKYILDFSKKVDSLGDLYAKKKIVYIDKHFPKKFHEGIAVHEIVERKFLVAGHSYGWSHNKATDAELEFYKKTFGEKNGEKVLIEEEKIVNKVLLNYVKEDLKTNKKGAAARYNSAYDED